MNSDNPTGADNQQETKVTRQTFDPSWIVCFVDGEGFLLLPYTETAGNANRRLVTHASFQVYQHELQRGVLEETAAFYGCGAIYPKGSTAKCSPTWWVR